jgi:uncharacterized protein YggE
MSSSTEHHPEPTVAAHGHYAGEAEPEYAHVMVTVSAAGSDRDRVLEQLVRRVDEIRQLIGGYGEAVERVEGHPLRGGPRFKDKKPTEKVNGYAASTDLGVFVVDFTALGELVLRLADLDMVAIAGPHWALRPDSPAHTRARSQAVRDARVRAEEYAAALGANLTGLVEIADTDLSGPDSSRPHAAGVPLARTSRGSSVADRVELDLAPVRQKVYATVVTRFTMSQPDFP